MNHGARLVGYLLVLAALAALLVAIPNAWATVEQSESAQMTIPTRTPKPASPTPSQPTDEPEPTETPAEIPTVLPGTAVPTRLVATPVTTPATPVTTAVLSLKKQVAPSVVWPGTTVHYTLTLSNQGIASAQLVEILDTLPTDLAPGLIAPGANARWQGQTLQAQAPILPPGSQLVIAYTAEVRVNTRPGGIIANQATAAAATNLRAVASASVALPPAELPPTGGFPDGILWTPVWGY